MNNNQVSKIKKTRVRLNCEECGVLLRTGKAGNRGITMRKHCIYCENKIIKANRSLWQRIKDLFSRG